MDLLHKRDCAPYVDFGVWGPNHHRLLKKLRTTGLQLHAGGVLKIIELSGPPDVETWSESFSLLCTALIGFGAVSLGPLMDYSRLITGYATRYGAATWPDVVTGEAPIERTHPAQSVSAPAGDDNAKRWWVERPRLEQTPKVHRETNGVHTHNRRGSAVR